MTGYTHRNMRVALLGSASAFLMASGAMAAEADNAANDDLSLVEEAQVQTAQQQQQAEEQQVEELELEEIVVTGSRIRRAGMFETAKPTIAIGEQRFEERNYVNVLDALNELPQFSDGIDNIGAQGAQAGESFADLFGLGTQRTLTLINGRRAIGGNGFVGAAVDLNIIPTALIERIDTVSIGGAPLYGTDAVAGTINIILKDDFEGLEVSGQFGITDEGDGAEKRFTALWGGNFADGRGNVNLSFEFVDLNLVRESDRRDIFFGKDFVDNPADTGPADDIPNQILIENSRIFVVTFGGFPLLSNFQLQNAFTGDNASTFPLGGPFEAFLSTPVLNADGQATQFGPNGELIPFDAGTRFAGEFAFAGGGDGIPIAIFNEVRVPTQRINATANAHFDVTDNVRMFGEFIFSTQDNFDPTNQPFINGNLFPAEQLPIGIPLSNPFLSDRSRSLIETSLQTATEGLEPTQFILLGNGGGGGILGADANGDGIPENIDTDGDGVADASGIFLSRFTRDVLDSLQSFENETDTYRFVAGLEGDFDIGDRQFNWDFAYNFGRNEGNQELPVRLVRNFFQAVDAVALTEDNIGELSGTVNAIRGFRPGEDVGEVVQVDASSARPGDIVCRVALEPPADPGTPVGVPNSVADLKTGPDDCVPLNLFGENNFVPEARDFVTAIDRNELNQEQETVEFNITGDIFELPGGSVQFASGILYRDESFEFSPGAVTEFGLNGTLPTPPTEGAFRTWEGYFEARIPAISRDMDAFDFGPFDWMLEINGTVRAIGNNAPGTGTDVAYTAGGRISPFEDLVFRGNFTRSVRAPAVGELFDPVSEFQDFAADPCDQSNLLSGPSPENRQANCRRRVIELGIADTAAEADQFLQNFQSIVGNASQPIFVGGGNPNLGNEIATNFTAGAQWTPSFIPGLVIGVDWVDIELTNAIFNVDQNSVLSACFDAAPSNFPPTICDQIRRNPNTFQLSLVETGFANIGFINFAGLTGRLEYQNSVSALPFVPEGDFGTFRLATNFQYIDQLENSVLGTGTDLDIDKGQATDPEFELVTTLNYDYHAFHFLLQMNWQEKVAIDPQATDEARNIQTIPDFTEFQASLGYDITDNITARFTIDNFTNAKPVAQAVATGFDDQFDLLGRRYSLRVTARY